MATALGLATCGLVSPAAAQQIDPVGRPVAQVVVETTSEGLRAEAEAALALAAGDRYTIERVRESLQNLWALGTVADARVRTAEVGEGLRVVFEVDPRMRLRDVIFEGTLPWSSGDLERALTVREGAPLDDASVERQVSRLQEELSDDGYLMAEVTGSVTPGDRPSRGTLRLHVEPGRRARLEELALVGALGLTEDEVRDTLDLRPGRPYRPAALEAAIDRLRAEYLERHYFFHSVEVLEQSFDLESGAVAVTLRLEAGPPVALTFSGLDEPEHSLHEELAIFEFGTVDDWALKEARHQLVRYLQERGYWRPLVSYSRSRDDEGRNVDVQFRILEGERRGLERIDFVGNGPVEADTLRAAIRSNTGGLLSAGRFLSEWWEQDQEAVVTVFRRRGYLQAQVVAAPVDREDEGLVATMVIEPGPQTHVGEFDIDVVADYPTPGIDIEGWRRTLEVRAASPHDPTAVRRDGDRLRALLTNSGYPRALVLNQVEPLAGEPPRVRVVQRIHPGARVRIGRVLVTGNESTDTDTIRRELGFVPGSPWSFADVLESQSRLYRTGLFEEVDVTAAEPDSLDPQRTMVVRVQEAPPLFINYGAGFDTEEKLRGIFAIGHENVFGGNQEINLSTRISLREQRLRLLYREPYLLGRRIETTATAFYTDEQEPAFDVQRWGGSVNLLLRRRSNLDFIGRYSFRDVQTRNIQIDSALIERQDRSTRVGALGVAIIYDTRPDPIDPHEGTYQTLDVDVAATALGSARDFVTVFGRSFWYYEVNERLVLAAALRAGVKIPFGDTVNVPLPERFFAGGSNTLRGFPLDGAGPVDAGGNPLGGEMQLVTNLEARFGIWGQLGGAVFFDWGNVLAKPADLRLGNLRETVGIGGRYETPVGPVRVDLAWLLDRRASEDLLQLFVSVGHTF